MTLHHRFLFALGHLRQDPGHKGVADRCSSRDLGGNADLERGKRHAIGHLRAETLTSRLKRPGLKLSLIWCVLLPLHLVRDHACAEDLEDVVLQLRALVQHETYHLPTASLRVEYGYHYHVVSESLGCEGKSDEVGKQPHSNHSFFLQTTSTVCFWV